MKLQLVSAALSALPLVFAGSTPVNSLWDLKTKVVALADGNTGRLGMVCDNAKGQDCMIAAVENCLVSAGGAMAKGERGGSQQATAKRDLLDLTSFAEKPATFGDGQVFTKFPDNIWRADVGHHLLNETVMEQASEKGTTYARKENGVVYVSSSHPHEKQENAKRGDFDNPQVFTDVIVTFRATAPKVNSIQRPDANKMAFAIINEGSVVPKMLCATIVDHHSGESGIADFGITINSDQWSFVKSEPACAA